jgi:hypothetical protein
VLCQVFVSGGGDPADEYQSMFFMDLKPKGYVFPEQPEDGAIFEIGQSASSVEELREYLAGGVDHLDGNQNWIYLSEEEENKYVRVLPAPFNDPKAVVPLAWCKEDVVFDAAAQLLCDMFDKAYSELELLKLDLDELRIIRAAKSALHSGCKKADLIDDILLDQKRKGLAAVRVKQVSLLEVVV